MLLISGTLYSMTGIDYIRAEQGSLAKGLLIMIKEPVNVRTFESPLLLPHSFPHCFLSFSVDAINYLQHILSL